MSEIKVFKEKLKPKLVNLVFTLVLQLSRLYGKLILKINREGRECKYFSARKLFLLLS